MKPKTSLAPGYLEINHLLSELPELHCWQAGLVLGSTLYMDFGEVLSKPGRHGKTIRFGSLSLGVRDVYWEFTLAKRILETSESIDRERFESVILPLLKGNRLTQIVLSNQRNCVEIVFADGVRFLLNIVDPRECEEQILVIYWPDGRVTNVSPTGQISCSSQCDQDRASYHVRKKGLGAN